jgi:hypothetical protein
MGPNTNPAALSIVWRAALGVLVASTSMRPFISLSCSRERDRMRSDRSRNQSQFPSFWRAPPNSGSFLGLFPAGCAKPSSSLSCSNDEPCRHGPCSSFRSSEEPHAGFTTVVLGCLTRASLGMLPVGCLRALAVARVGVVGPKLAECSRDAHGKERADAFARYRTDPTY